jgi:hypothetical protein
MEGTKMKVRQGFVSNSSSSSFVVMTAGSEVLFEDGDTEMEMECCGGFTVPIDEMIEALQKAKAAGAKVVEISHGGGYDG